MRFEDITFPVYRKYRNNKNYFKIINPRLFEELVMIGKRPQPRTVDAVQFPEQNFVRDLVFNHNKMVDEITEEEYCEIRSRLKW